MFRSGRESKRERGKIKRIEQETKRARAMEKEREKGTEKEK